MFTGSQPPRLPDPPRGYEVQYMAQLLDTLRVFFDQLFATQQVNVARLNIDMRTLPTQADVANLRSGDVYVDTSAGNVLKIKP